MRLLTTAILAICATLSLASEDADACTAPVWTMTNFTVKYEPDLSKPAASSFYLTSTLMTKTELIVCPLRANQRCGQHPTSFDKTLEFDIQANIYYGVLEVVQKITCPGSTT